MGMFSEIAKEGMYESIKDSLEELEKEIKKKEPSFSLGRYAISNLDLTPLYDSSKDYTHELLKIVMQICQYHSFD